MIALLLAGCAPPGTPVEQWELLGLNHNQAAIEITLRQDDLDLLRGQGRVTVEVSQRKSLPIRFARGGLPDEVSTPETGRGMKVGPDELVQRDQGWDIRIQEDDLSARLTLTPLAGDVPPFEMSPNGGWTVEAPALDGTLQGFVRAAGRDEFVDGRAVLLRRHGARSPALRGASQRTLVIFADQMVVAVDHTGSAAMGWVGVSGAFRPINGGVVRQLGPRQLELDLRPEVDLVARVKLRPGGSIQRELFAHLTRPERWLLRTTRGWPVRQLHSGRAELLVGGETLSGRALHALSQYM